MSNEGTRPEESTMTAGVSPVETGLILPVAELEEFVTMWRTRVHCVPPAGVPAHISLLYPFLSPEGCGIERKDIAEFFAKIEPFEFDLTEVAWFDGRVVFLRPDDPGPFLDVTEQLVARWTQCLPYGGKHAELVPHLTLGIDGTADEMNQLAEAAEKLLPVHCRVTEAWLMVGTSGPPAWQASQRFELGG